MVARSTAVFAFVVSLWSTAGNAVVFTYTDESEYLAKLSTLGYGQWSENFEGAAWDGLRTTRDIGAHPTYHTAAAATSQGITWEGPSYQSPITTEQRFHFLPGEDSASYAANKWALTAVTRRADLDTFKGTSANMLYGVGGWFDSMSGYKYDEDSQSYIPKGHMFVSLDGGLTYDDFGAGGDADPYKLINAIAYDKPPRFFGIVDTAGFNSFIFRSDQLLLTDTGGFPGESSEPGFYGPVVYADSFTFAATQAVPEPSIWTAMTAGLLLLGLRLGRRATPAG
jgi:hypothetical protein